MAIVKMLRHFSAWAGKRMIRTEIYKWGFIALLHCHHSFAPGAIKYGS